MRNVTYRFPYSAVSVCSGVVAVLAIAYIGLIAMVMTYAALTVEFSQSVRNDETAVAKLEKQYLATMENKIKELKKNM